MAGYQFIIVDDHPLFRGALSQALGDAFAQAEVFEAGSLDELIEHLATTTDIDLVLLDLTMPGVHGVSGLLYLRAQHPEIPVAIVSASDDPGTIRHCLDCGASGFISKSQPVEAIRDAIRRILAGEVWLPPDVDLSNLPTDTAQLRQLIVDRKVEGGPAGDAETFTIIGDLLRETYAPPALRAALYHIAAGLPGVQLIGTVKDQAGRTGTAVAYASRGLRQELIFDPATSALLAEQSVVADPAAAQMDVPAGTVMGWAVYLASGVVDSTSQRAD